MVATETLVFSLTVTDDEGAGRESSVSVVVNPVNVAPTIDAGSDQSVGEQTNVTFNGIASDSDGAIVSYLWTQVSGSSVTINSATTLLASFISPTLVATETLIFTLTVIDDEGASTESSVSVVVNPVNLAPTVDAGSTQTVYENLSVTISASANDSDGSIVSYLWSQTSGSSVTLNDGTTASANFIAPNVASLTDFTFQAVVTDNKGVTATDTVTIYIENNLAPTAVFSLPLFIISSNDVIFDGSASTDPELNTLSYQWLQTDSSGINIVLDDDTLAQPTFTVPVVTFATTLTFSLTVTDSSAASHSAEHTTAITPDNSVLASVNDTGFSLCGDYGIVYRQNDLDCADPDPDGDVIPVRQDGHVGRDINNNSDEDGLLGFSFIKLDSNGSPLPASATEWSCVLDVVTQLVWEVKTVDGGLQDKSHIYSWYNSNNLTNGGDAGSANLGSCLDTNNCDTEKYVTSINTVELCGKSDWTMPSYIQLQSLIDYSATDPAIDSNYFSNTFSGWYWSSTTFAPFPGAAWLSHFDLTSDAPDLKSDLYPVRLVRKVN